MPTFDKRARYPATQNRIAIPTLSGGVGRQAPTKRAINEAQNLDNILVTLERSVEKRPGTNHIRRYSNAAMTTLGTGDTTSSLVLNDRSTTADYKFFWFQVAETQRYLIAINFSGESNNTKSNYIQIFKVTKNGFLECNLSGHDTDSMFNYFKYKSAGSTVTADDSLSSITLGPQMLINNSNVFSGYTSKLKTFVQADVDAGVRLETKENISSGAPGDGTQAGVAVTLNQKAWCTVGLDGEFHTYTSSASGSAKTHYVEDTKGRKLDYFTTTPVDKEGQASIYVNGKFYVKNDQVFVSVPENTDLNPYLKKQITGSGSFKFGERSDDGGSPAAAIDKFSVLTEDLPTSLTDLNVTKFVVDDSLSDGAETITLEFSTQASRDAFLNMTRFSVAGYSLPMLNDGSSGDYITTNGSGSLWRLIWTAKAPNDADFVHKAADAVTAAFEAPSTDVVPFTVAFDFVGIFNADESTFPTTLTAAYNLPGGGTGHFVDASDGLLNTTPFAENNANVLVFTCQRDGTASGTIPQSAVDASSSEPFWNLRSDDDGGPIAKYIPVQDWKYPDSNRRYLGNELADFSEFNFPPKDNEATLQSDGGSDANKAAGLNVPPNLMEGKIGNTLSSLYTDIDSQGRGKIYYVENSYAGEVPGYYIIRQVEESPYTRLVRTPEEYSVLDEDRFPKIIKIDSFTGGIENFVVSNMDLEERRSGNLTTNPGPEAFKDGKQTPIKSLAFFRDRLFLSAGDTVFSSRTGDFSDLWSQNPGLVADTDPIDVRLSTNKYAEVESMTPFASSLFINTGSDIQFTLKGSENNITPFTAEVSPTAFYSTSPLVNPVLLGSQIYFFAPERAYVYFNDSTVTVNQAIEVSLNCPNYLPKTYGDVAVVPGYDSLCMVDKDNKKFVYIYTNRYRGADVVQNAFFRYVYDHDVVAINSYDNDFFLVFRETKPTNADNDKYRYYLSYQKFHEQDNSLPRLDHQVLIDENVVKTGTPNHPEGSIVYNSSGPLAGKTVITVKHYGNPNPDTLYIAGTTNSEETRDGEVIQLGTTRQNDIVDPANPPVTSNGTLTITLIGDFTTASKYRKFIIGTSYTSTIELSPQYMRDEGNNVVEGVLSLRTLHLVHHNTGSYRVEKATRGRRVVAHKYTPSEVDDAGAIVVNDEVVYTGDPDDVPMPLYEKHGESFTKIMGYAAETDIFIVSDYPNPMNIAQIELKGKFTNKTSGFVR